MNERVMYNIVSKEGQKVIENDFGLKLIPMTKTAQIPNNVGFPRVMQGVTRKLTAKEKKQQKELQKRKS